MGLAKSEEIIRNMPVKKNKEILALDFGFGFGLAWVGGGGPAGEGKTSLGLSRKNL